MSNTLSIKDVIKPMIVKNGKKVKVKTVEMFGLYDVASYAQNILDTENGELIDVRFIPAMTNIGVSISINNQPSNNVQTERYLLMVLYTV